MKTNILTTAIVAAAGLLLASAPAKALTSNDADIFLGVRSTNNTAPGGTSDYLIDLGSATNFTSLALQSFVGTPGAAQGIYATGSTVAITNIAADLSALFGAGWATRTDLAFGLAGQDQNGTVFGTASVFASKAQSPSGTLSTPWANGNSSQLSGVAAEIQAQQAKYNTGSAGDNPNGTVQANAATTANTWAYYMPTGNGSTAGTAYNNYNGSAGNGLESFVDPHQVDLYYQDATTGSPFTSYVGSFDITAAGNVEFNSNGPISPVPEPASIGILTSAFLGLVGISRRRRGAHAVQA